MRVGRERLATEDVEKIDPAVVAALYLEHADELRAFLLGVLKSPDLAAEVLQLTFTKALEVGHKTREETRKGWLFRVAFHEAMALRRRQKVRDSSMRKLALLDSTAQTLPHEHLIHWETVDRVRSAMAVLPVEQCQVVRERIYHGKTFAVIAEELGLPLGTVLTRMRLALAKLALQLKPDMNPEE